MPKNTTSRRIFLKHTGVAAMAVAALGACDRDDKPPVKTGAASGAQTGGTMGPHDTGTGAPALSTAEQMDAMHEKGVKAFPAKTALHGNQLLAPRIVAGMKVFELTAKVVQWETEPGRFVTGWSYNGGVPGPQIRVREGDRVRIVLKNELPESTAMHFHGLEVPNDQDGVPFIVEPKTKTAYDDVDIDYVMILNDGAHGYTLNGKSFPATEPVVAKRGQKVRVRYMNEGMMIHPMHLHGMHMTVIAKDGWMQPAPWKCDTLNIAPGERWDVIVNCTNPGTWAFHCHILPHAESEHGMFGMVTALIVK